MKSNIQVRTISRNGQVAIPKRFLEALGLTPPAKVQLIQERDTVVIRRGSMTRMSDEALQELLARVRRRNAGVTSRQVTEAIRQVRRPA